MVIKLKLYRLFLPFALLIAIVTLRISSYLNNEDYFDELKEKFKQELDIISLSKKFLGKIQYIYFDDVDYNVSSDEVFYELDNDSYYVLTNTSVLLSKNDAVCVSIQKNNNNYTIKLRSEELIITYYQVANPYIRLYEYVEAGEEICNLHYNESYYYVVNYEN